MSQSPFASHLSLLLLAQVAQGSTHGASMIANLREQSQGVFTLTEGAVYPVLHRLERDGFLSSSQTVVGGRRRRAYELTGAGREHFRERQSAWRRFETAIEAVLETTAATDTDSRDAGSGLTAS